MYGKHIKFVVIYVEWEKYSIEELLLTHIFRIGNL